MKKIVSMDFYIYFYNDTEKIKPIECNFFPLGFTRCDNSPKKCANGKNKKECVYYNYLLLSPCNQPNAPEEKREGKE